MSTAAPAFGMMGTIVGLVLMLAETGSVRAVMQSMSIAMLTTLYGVIISNLIIFHTIIVWQCYFKLYHELHNLHNVQRTAAERARIDYCIELMHDIHRIVNES